MMASRCAPTAASLAALALLSTSGGPDPRASGHFVRINGGMFPIGSGGYVKQSIDS